MSTTSAVPTNLEVFASTLATARATCSHNVTATNLQYQAMIAVCGGAGVASTNLASLSALLTNFATNEQYVGTIHDELVAADHGGSTPASMADTTLLAALQSKGLATAPPPVEVRPSEVFGVPPTSGFVDDPVCAANGNFVHAETDLEFPGFSSALNVFRFYNSLDVISTGGFGPGWTSIADIRLSFPAVGWVTARIPDGATVWFAPPAGTDPSAGWTSTGRRDLRLLPTADGWRLVESRERTWHFAADGTLLGAHLGPARLEVLRAGAIVTGLVERRSGRSVTFRWDGSGAGRRIVGATSDDGRAVTYRYDRAGVLVGATGLGGTAAYEVDGPLIVAARDADGVELFRNVYDETGRVLRQTSPFGRITDYSYGAGGSTVITDQFGVRNAMVHDRRGNLTAVVDTEGRAMRLSYDRRSRVTSVTDRSGNVWRYELDDGTGDLLARIDPDGRRAEWTWDDQQRVLTETDRGGNVTRHEYTGDLRTPSVVIGPDGATATSVHDERGLPVSITDPDGVIVHLEWDRDGQLTGVTDALGGHTTIEFDDAGLYVRMLDAVGVETRVERDPAGRILRHVVPGATSSYRYTAAGRVQAGTEPGDVHWSARFGHHGKPVAITDGTGSTAELTYDANGAVTAVTAPDGAVYRNRFDAMGQLLDNVDPSGAAWQRRRDANGNIVEFVDGTGRSWSRVVDAWGRTLVSTAPDGATTTYTYHAIGGIATVTGPDGRRWTSEIDVNGRETTVIDPLGRRSEIEYTPGGRVAVRRSPAGRTERCSYDAAGRVRRVIGVDGTAREVERDQRGRIIAFHDEAGSDADGLRLAWTAAGLIARAEGPEGAVSFDRTESGSLRSIVDASGVRTQFEWDERGQLAAAGDGAGNVNVYGYDSRGRLSAQTTPTGAATTRSYDTSGHLGSISEPASGVTSFRNDAVGRLQGVRRADGTGWDATLDAAGRTTAITSTAGNVLAGFAYDLDGRLTETVTGDGFATSFLWDDANDLAGSITPDDARTYERDADGLVVAERDASGAEVRYVRADDGTITAIVDSVLGELAVPAPSPAQRDASGRILARADGTTYRYDAAGRLIEVVPATDAPTTYQYGDTGLLASESTGGRLRRYAYDAAGRLVGMVDLPGGRHSFSYDRAGHRVAEEWPDGTHIDYRWNELGQLVGISRTHPGGAVELTGIDVDALGRAIRAKGTTIGWDHGRTRQVDRIGTQRYLRAGGRVRVAVAGSDWFGDTSPDPWGERHQQGVRLNQRGELAVDALVLLGARPYDPNSRQFLAPDLLDPKPGTAGAASPYTYGWQDPVNFVDPSGLRPISQAEFDAIRKQEEQGKLGQAWEAIKEDPWGAAGMALVVAAGVGLCFVPGGQAIGVGILIGVGTSAGMGIATGTFDPRAVAISGVVGAISGGTASAATTIPRAIAIGAATEGAGNVATQLVTGDGTINWTEAAISTGAGGLTGGLAQKFFPVGASNQADELLPNGTGSGTGAAQPFPSSTPPSNVNLNTGNVSVYTSSNAAGDVDYVGITNDVARRGTEHLAQKGITISEIPGLTTLSRADAKAVEQVLIEANGGAKGAQLLNKINSIATTNPVYAQSLARGQQLLQAVGYIP